MFCNPNPKRGVLLYVRKELQARECLEFNNIENCEEFTFCTFNDINNNKVLIGCFYRSPSSNWDNTLNILNLLKTREVQKYDNICIVGDFNFPTVDWCGRWKGETEAKILSSLNDAFLVQKVTQTTRSREGNRPSLLDLVLVNDTNLISSIVHNDPLGKSDHNVLLFDLYVPLTCIPRYSTVKKHDFKRGDYISIRKEVSEMLSINMENMDVQEIWNTIHKTLSVNIEKHIPKIQSKNVKRIKPSWANTEIMKMIRKKHDLFKLYRKSKSTFDHNKYKSHRNKCKQAIRSAKDQYESFIAENCNTNPKLFWNYIKEKTKGSSNITALKTDDGYATSDKEKADTLNVFFSSVFTRENNTNMPILEAGLYSKNVFLPNLIFTPKAIEDKMNNLNVSKSQGPDMLPARLLKELSKELSGPLCIFFNKSLKDGIVPHIWKKAVVTAIFKKGSRCEPGNYRPVSLTCILCKLMESIIRDVINSYFNDNNLFAKCQHGFRNKRSCTSQLLEVMEDITGLLDEGSPIDIAYLDFRKAFDSVPHNRLLLKLEAYGITGNLLGWIESFLKNRSQVVKVGDAHSNEGAVLNGIPQGSILGPVLFSIFINDLPNGISSYCKIFADDTKLYNTSGNQLVLQNDISILQHWSDKWQLYFNVDKCSIMHLGSNNPQHSYSMVHNGQVIPIKVTTEEKDLGVIFDPNLSFDKHIHKVTNKANQMLGLIRRSFRRLNKRIFLKLYKALIRPHLEYGNTIWSPHLKRQSIAVEKVQRRATRQLRECKDMSYEERLYHLHLHSLKGRRIRGDLIETYKIFNNKVNLDWNYFFSSPNISSTRNSHGKIFIKHCKSNTRKNCFSNRICNHWNNLNFNIKTAINTNAFKSLLDETPKFKTIFYSFDE